MEENNLVIMSLTTLEEYDKMRSGAEDYQILEKNFLDWKNKSVGKALEYMLDPREDALNPAYNKEQRDLRDRIESWKKTAIENQNTASPDKFDLLYAKSDGTLSTPLQLNRNLSDYPDIIKRRTTKDDFGSEKEYNAIDLVANFTPGQGYRKR